MTFILREPQLLDGMRVFELIKSCPPLDTNSSYCNFLQASHFAKTSVVAESNGEFVGFVSGYILPDKPHVLFIWQVAVSESARGQGLGLKMLQHLLSRPVCQSVDTLHTTITEDNTASWRLFERLSKTLSAPLSRSVWIDKTTHFNHQHESEILVEIGSFKSQES